MSKEVALKIQKVMASVSAIGKVKKGGVSYEFQAWEDVLPAVRAACIEHGLVIVPSMGQSEIGEWQGSNSKSATHNVPLRFLLIDVDSGESIEAEWSGESRDVSDKGKQKAATSGMKYWLLKLFMIVDRESVESDEANGLHEEIKPQTKKNGASVHKASDLDRANRWLNDNGLTPKSSAYVAVKELHGDKWRECVCAYIDSTEGSEYGPTVAGLPEFAKKYGQEAKA